MDDIKNLIDAGSPYMRDSFIKKRKVTVSYNANMPCIGITQNGSKYHLDLTESTRIFIFGPTRAGKTWLLRSLMDRLHAGGNAMINLHDIKDELKSSIFPVQEKFRHKLLPNEKPTGLKVVTLRPTYFKQLLPSNPNEADLKRSLNKYNFWYSPNMGSISESDFMTLLNVNKMNQMKQSVMADLLRDCKDLMESGDFDFEVLIDMIDEVEDATTSTKNQLRWQFKPLLRSFFVDPNYERDLIDLIKKGFIPSINFEGYQKFSDTGFCYTEALVGIILNEVITAKVQNRINKVWIIFDEMGRIVNDAVKNTPKDLLIESFERDTRYGVNYVLATQDLETTPQRLIENCRYMFIPAIASVNVIRKALMDFGYVRNVQASWNDANNWKARLNESRREWLVLDRKSKHPEVITVVPPLSWHMESEDGPLFNH